MKARLACLPSLAIMWKEGHRTSVALKPQLTSRVQVVTLRIPISQVRRWRHKEGSKWLFKVTGSILGSLESQSGSSLGNHQYYKVANVHYTDDVHYTQGDLPKVTWPGNGTPSPENSLVSTCQGDSNRA